MPFFERFERVARDIVEKTTECITILILFGFLVEHIKWKFIQWIALSFLIRQINRKNVNNRCNFELLCHLFVGMGIVATIIFVSLTFHIYTLFHLHILFFALFFLTLFHMLFEIPRDTNININKFSLLKQNARFCGKWHECIMYIVHLCTCTIFVFDWKKASLRFQDDIFFTGIISMTCNEC